MCCLMLTPSLIQVFMTCVHQLPFQGGELLCDQVMDSESKTNDTMHADDNHAGTAPADAATTANLTTSTVRPWVKPWCSVALTMFA